MAIDKLRYFAAVVETKNLRKAAELLGINAGSLSKSVSSLETELGFKLLRPEGRGIDITEQGWKIYRSSAHLLHEYRRFQDNIKVNINVQSDRFRFGTFEVFSSYFSAAFFTTELPMHEVFLLELTPGKIEAAILDNLIDFGITYMPDPHSDLSFVEIGQFEMAIWGHLKWIDKPFKDWPFAVPTTSIQIHSIESNSLDMWPQTKQKRWAKYEFELLETALQTSRMGNSVIHCPDFIIKLHNRHLLKEFRLVKLPYPFSLKPMKPVKIFLVHKKGNDAVKLVEGKLAKFLRSLK